MPCEYCTDPNGDPCYPQYGLAPHMHGDFWQRVTPIYTVFAKRELWPDNFIEDPDLPNHGTWYCPHCKEGLDEHRHDNGGTESIEGV